MASRPALSVARINDTLLGSVGASIPPSHTLDHLVRYLSTWSGSDKLFMTAQYGSKLLAPLLQLRAETQYRAGRRPKPWSPGSEALGKFAGSIADARRIWGLWGILPIFQWLSSLERTNPSTRALLTIERLQGLSMLVFYPLEAISYLSSSSAPLLRIPPSVSAKAGVWSVRAWAAYVALQLVHLRHDWVAALRTERALAKGKVGGNEKAETYELEVAAVKKRKWAIRNELIVNLANLPLTIHWSIDGGIFTNPLWVNVFSMIAALASFRGGWEATRLPAPVR